MNEALRTRFLGLDLATPLVLPAGILGTSYSSLLACARLGAGLVTTKSMTLTARSGHPGPVVAPVTGGFLNAVGISNPGIVEGLREVNEYCEQTRTPIAVSLFADNAGDFVELARHVNDTAAQLIELNLSCPNVADEFGAPIAASPAAVAEIVEAVRAVSLRPVIAKLSPNVPSVTAVARAAERAGADAICAINTLGPGMSIDIVTRRPILSNRTGGLSGPAIRSVAVRVVYEIAGVVAIPVIGVGGVTDARDAVEMLIAGARLVGIGSAIYPQGMQVFSTVADGILDFLSGEQFASPDHIPRLEPIHV